MHNDAPDTPTTNQPSDHTPRRIPVLDRLSRHTAVLTTGLVAGALLGGGGYAIAASHTTTIHGCVNNKTHALTVQKRCARGTKTLTWDQTGPRGKTGPQGKAGATGPQGAAGGANVIVDSASIGSTGTLGATNGISAVQHPSTGTYLVTATGCSSNPPRGGAAQVTVEGTANAPIVVANVNGDGLVDNQISEPIFAVHLWETASTTFSGGTPTWTTLTNPVPFDDSFGITVTC